MGFIEIFKEIEIKLGERVASLPQPKRYCIGLFRGHNNNYWGQQGNFYGNYETKEEAQKVINNNISFINKISKKYLIHEEYMLRVVCIDGYMEFIYESEINLEVDKNERV